MMLGLLGQFLLEIRRSMGNEETKFTNWEMLEWFLKDARRYSDESVIDHPAGELSNLTPPPQAG